MIDVASFMQRTALGERRKNRIPYLRFLQLSVGHLQVEFRQVPAVQVADQIAGAQIDVAPDALHAPF
jgi:hypothetical protein